jgi:hypothetical protein
LTKRGDSGDALAERPLAYLGIDDILKHVQASADWDLLSMAHSISPESQHSRSKLLNLTGFFSSGAGLLIGIDAAMPQKTLFDQP